eukprot:320877-Chlamydomonas_euryale.AAC.1
MGVRVREWRIGSEWAGALQTGCMGMWIGWIAWHRVALRRPPRPAARSSGCLAACRAAAERCRHRCALHAVPHTSGPPAPGSAAVAALGRCLPPPRT